MTIRRFLLAIICFTAFSTGRAAAPSLEDLARFFEVESWNTFVDVPTDSYTVEIYHFSAGIVGKRLIGPVSPAATLGAARTKLSVLVGLEDGKYKIMVGFGDATARTVVTPVQKFEATVPPHFPNKIEAGDFILFGNPTKEAKTGQPLDLNFYSEGILLRVQKAT